MMKRVKHASEICCKGSRFKFFYAVFFQSKQPSRSHSFPIMSQNQRRCIHELAEHYGCDTQSYDYEPKKNVVATAPKYISISYKSEKC